MARKPAPNNAGCGWIVAGALGLMLLGKCGESPRPPDPAPVAAYEAPASEPQPEEVRSPPQSLVSAPEPVADAPSCGAKRYCKQMNSCTEATHYLNECGLSRLDRDGDGIPCESIC